MDKHVILALADEHPMVDVDRLDAIYQMLSHTLLSNVPGAVVELGCNAGATSVFLRMILDEFAPHRALHIYDSFQGLPLKGAYDRCFDAGDLRASTAEIEANFRRCGLRVPYVHEGWFQDTLPTALPHPIAFAYLDSDFYASIMVSLEHVYPRLAPHAVVLIDDYGAGDHTAPAAHGLPGVKQACDDFFVNKPETVAALAGSRTLAMGYFRKQ